MNPESTTSQQHVDPSTNDASLVLSGEIDLANVPELQTLIDQVIKSSAGTIRINMADVSYLDSTGLHVLLAASDRLLAEHRRLVITRASRQVQRLLEVCGLTARLMSDLPEDQRSAPSRPRGGTQQSAVHTFSR